MPDPATTKIVDSQSAADAFSAIVAFHEVGLRAGQGVSYRVAGTGTVNYSCFRTDGTLASAPGTEQLVTAGVSGNQRLIADASGEVNGVIVIPPPSPRNAACPAGYAIGALLYDSVGRWLIHAYGYGANLAAFRAAYAKWGAAIILIKGLTPIPYKLVTIASGFAGYNLWLFVVLSILTRGVSVISCSSSPYGL